VTRRLPGGSREIGGTDPIDTELIYNGLATEHPTISVIDRPEWTGGIEQPIVERVPIADRIAWRISFTPEQQSYGTTYLLPVTDDPYGPFVSMSGLDEELLGIVERMLIRLEFTE
jgi:hypothetical protein